MEDVPKVKPNSSSKTLVPCNIVTSKNRNAVTAAMRTHPNAAIAAGRTIIMDMDTVIAAITMVTTMTTTIDRVRVFVLSRTVEHTTTVTMATGELVEVSLSFYDQ